MMKVILCLALALLVRGDGLTKKDWFEIWKHGGAGDWISLARSDVQDDLGLSSDARDKIAAMVKTFVKEQGELDAPNETERNKLIVKHKADYLKKAHDLIGEDKFKRLEQIHFQMLGNGAIAEPSYAKLIGVEDGQKSKIQEANDNYNQQLSGLLYQIQEGDVTVDEVEKELERLEMIVSSDCARIYTKAQIAKLTELRGKPFSMKFTPLWWQMVRR
jgi:hypothetical protein